MRYHNEHLDQDYLASADEDREEQYVD